MLQPKKTKFRRQQKGRQKGNAQRGNQLAFGSFGIKALETKWITGRQIEAARIAVTRYMQRQGQIWIRIFPDKPITRKPADVRMGKGKGAPEGFVAPVTPGRIIITYCKSGFYLYHNYLALSIISTNLHLLVLLKGRVSMMCTVSPILHSFFSS